MKKETEEGLEAFRRLREEAEKAEKEKEATLAKSELKAADEEWDFKSKKRKAGPVKLRLNLGIKHRKLSGDTDAGNQDLKEVEKPVASEDKACKDDTEGAKPDSLGAKSASADLETEKKPAAGLVAYALDDDDDW